MQRKCKERKRPKKLFFFFLPIKAELTKDAKNKTKMLGNTERQEDFIYLFFISKTI
jgi:hypothetical protein